MTPRRGKGEGSVYQRASDGRWVGVVDLGWVGGKRVRKAVYGATQREVIKRRRELQASLEAGVVPSNATVEQWLTYWLDHIAVHKVRARTLIGYRGYVTQWIVPLVGKIRLSKLTPDHVRAMHTAMREAGKADATVRQAHAILQRAMRVAVAEQRTLINPAQVAGGPRVGTRHHAHLTAEQSRAALAAATTTRDAARLTCALLLGLRQGEAIGLTWDRVILTPGAECLVIEQAVQRHKGKGLVVTSVKSAASRRTVPLPPAAAEALHRWKAESGGAGFVFGGQKPTAPEADWRWWRDLLATAKVPHVPLHGARASAATLLRDIGVSERVIADILGHAHVDITAQAYLRSDDPQRRAALTALGEALTQAPTEPD